MDLSNAKLIDENNLLQIANILLQYIDFFGVIIGVNKQEIHEFAKTIGPQLIKCHLQYCDFRFVIILVKHLKNEALEFEFYKECDAFKVFYYLNRNCQHLKVLKWNSSIRQNEDMINVMNRIEHLEIEFIHFIDVLKLKKFIMNNLTQLKMNGFVIKYDYDEEEMIFKTS